MRDLSNLISVETLTELLAENFPLTVQRAAMLEFEDGCQHWTCSAVAEYGGVHLVTEVLRLMENSEVGPRHSLV